MNGVSDALKKAYKLFTDGKFSAALQAFNQMLWTIPLVVVTSRKEVDEVKELISICRFVKAAHSALKAITITANSTQVPHSKWHQLVPDCPMKQPIC